MQKHWRRNGPPVYLSVAAYLGFKPEKETKKTERTPETEAERLKGFEELFNSFAGTGGFIQ